MKLFQAQPFSGSGFRILKAIPQDWQQTFMYFMKKLSIEVTS